jgi:hypothetical protein
MLDRSTWVDSFVSVGNSDQTTKLIILGFTFEPFVKQAYTTVRSLQTRNQISRDIEPCYLPDSGVEPPRGFHMLWLFMPVEVDAYEMVNTLVPVLRQRLGAELCIADMALEQQTMYAVTYHEKKR